MNGKGGVVLNDLVTLGRARSLPTLGPGTRSSLTLGLARSDQLEQINSVNPLASTSSTLPAGHVDTALVSTSEEELTSSSCVDCPIDNLPADIDEDDDVEDDDLEPGLVDSESESGDLEDEDTETEFINWRRGG